MWSDVLLRMLILVALLLNACASSDHKKQEKSDHEIAENYLQMGVGYMELGKNRIALQRLQHALQLDEDNSEIHNALGVLYQNLGDAKRAEQYFGQSLDLNPDNVSAKNNYGRFLCDQGLYDKAMVYLNEALAAPMNTRKWFALTNIGICKYNRNETGVAERYLREALQKNPNYAPALQQMIAVSYDKKNYISAKGFLERFLARSKHTPKTLYYAMLIEMSLGNTEKADRYKATLLEKFPLSKEAQRLN